MQASRIGGDTRVELVSGNMVLRGCLGDVDFSTSSGSAEIDDVVAKAADGARRIVVDPISSDPVLYVSAEESPRQVKLRAERLGISSDLVALEATAQGQEQVHAVRQAGLAGDEPLRLGLEGAALGLEDRDEAVEPGPVPVVVVPRRAAEADHRIRLVELELDEWAKYGVEGHFHSTNPWYSYHERLTPPMAKIVGARESEVVCMNSLTTNIHLMFVSFYRPTPERYKIISEAKMFPSDRYLLETQAQFHGFDPDDFSDDDERRAGKRFRRVMVRDS